MLTIIVAALALAIPGCAPAGGLLLDGDIPGGGGSAVCFSPSSRGQEVIFGAGLMNESDTDLTITDVTLLAQNTVLVSELAVADPGTDGVGWGVSILDDLPSTQVEAWESRRDAIGATVPAGEQVWLLIVARTGGSLDQRTGIRGLRVEYDGALWPRSTQSQTIYGFGPLGSECDAGMDESAR
ncbi:hypothetical protein [Microcella humidisoli]|uniref:DUF4352 domain-containing protein n=1 Tax=Microcella humidisoli TaxID=2963406 RepID=A0ABY5FXD1_9MICO|nr:hypothetical protein [Microcella humidisoli]UTT62971.1 hypothetical protein NNL39_02370 [Microcella humidisoli]